MHDLTNRRKPIGFDRKIRLEWLEATADWTASGLAVAEIRSKLWRLLEGQVAGETSRSARDKTVTVLLHIWANVPGSAVAVCDDALALLRACPVPEHQAFHWGMCLATYPFFSDVAAVTGRLLSLQGKAAQSQITRRMTEAWGDRGIVNRALRHVVRSLVLWDVLRDTSEKGVYQAGPRIQLPHATAAWLVEAAMSNSTRARSFRTLRKAPELFPFALDISPRELDSRPRLEIVRHGLDEDLVVLNRS